jgi:DNA-binding transcriptional ArsR family regulator
MPELKKQQQSISEKIAKLARVFSDENRVGIILLLSENHKGMTTMDLSTQLGVLQPRVSSHLALLLEQKIVSVKESGRQRIYTLNRETSPIIKELLSLFSLEENNKNVKTPTPSAQAIIQVRKNSELRQHRTCYDHLAGVAGVELLETMLSLGWLSEERKSRVKKSSQNKKIYYKLTPLGRKSFEERGVDLVRAFDSKRTLAYGCLDWTETKPHLGGSLGSAVLDSLLSSRIFERKKGTRALVASRPISRWL